MMLDSEGGEVNMTLTAKERAIMIKLEDKYRLGENVETYGTYNGVSQIVRICYVMPNAFNPAYAAWETLCHKMVLNAHYNDREFYAKYARCQLCYEIAQAAEAK